ANAIAIAGTGYNSLRVTRTGALSHWKGLAYPNTAMGAMHATLLASYGITGPEEVFEGNKGFMDSIAGKFDIDWSKEDLNRVTKIITERYNDEIHSQTSIEGLLELKDAENIAADDIKEIRLYTFDVAFNIIGGGEEGGKKNIQFKEEADHSLPYMLAVAYLDGQVMPDQYEPARITSSDVQDLLQKVHIEPVPAYRDRFPPEVACRIELATDDGQVCKMEKDDYHGLSAHPADWDVLIEEYTGLTSKVHADLADKIAAPIKDIENVDI